MSEYKALVGPVAVVCHDAGAANIILEEIRAAPQVKWLPVMQGPAARLWAESGLDTLELLTTEAALQSANSVLTGTGWASNLEHEARLGATLLGLKSVAVIDHWVNYAARFERNGVLALPDEIWVTDTHAFDIASGCFIGHNIKLQPNRYLDAQVRSIEASSASLAGQILYVLEPLRFSWPGCTQLGEFEALDYFVSNLSKIASEQRLQIRLRPHPSDAADKYKSWMAKNIEHGISIDTSLSLGEAIGRVQWVAGCETAAMVVALAAGRKVLSTLPPNAPRCRLPHAGILHLRDF